MTKVEKIEAHLRTHPSDYQSVISLYKNRSKEIERERKKAYIEKRKKIAEWRERLEHSQL